MMDGAQTHEYLLTGSVTEAGLGLLVERLRSLCEEGEELFEHEMHFVLLTPNSPSTSLKVRRPLGPTGAGLGSSWQVQYWGAADPQLSAALPTLVRNRMDARVASRHMMEFLRGLGFRLKFEHVAKGLAFAKGNFKLTLAQISRTTVPGQVERREPLSESHLVTLSTVVRGGAEDPRQVAASLADFAAQLRPIVHLTKPDLNPPTQPSMP